ncbi:MAG: response regulator transcription factor [Flavobacteriales bacterium]|nr:response regulator transcription factor [Flavobacteriales bacterium]
MTLLLVDDQSIILDGLEALLAHEPDVQVVGRATSGAEAVERAKELFPDVVLMDISMPGMDGIEATKALLKCCTDTRVLVLSMYDHPDLVREIMEAGARGYVLKNVGKEELGLALRAVAAGDRYIGRDVQEAMDHDHRFQDRAGATGCNVLTKREQEVVKLICREYSTAEIAEMLFLSPQTVDTHRKNILQKLAVKNSAGLVKYAMERGWC